MSPQSDALSTASPVARALYDELLRALAAFGPFETEMKKASIHLVRSSAFAGVHLRKAHLLLTINAAAPIPSGRIIKTEQVSANRWHLDIKLTDPGDIDAELLAWLREAYDLAA
jgi:hypothetical protein